MAKVNLIKKQIQMGKRDIIKYQLITHCFVKDIQLSNNELNCLTLLGVFGEHELSEFCNTTVQEGIFKTSQTVRNFLTKAQKLGLVKKEGTNKKKISLVRQLAIQAQGNILLKIEALHVTQEQ